MCNITMLIFMFFIEHWGVHLGQQEIVELLLFNGTIFSKTELLGKVLLGVL